jgi:hypothetical protein
MPLVELHYKGRLLPLSAYIRLGWKILTMINTLAYYRTKIITAVKRFAALTQSRFSAQAVACTIKVLRS